MITFYSATLIKNLGYSPRAAALLNTPSGAVAIFATLLVGFGVRYKSNRWIWIVGCCIPGIAGASMMSFLPTSNRIPILVGISLVNFVVPTGVLSLQWLASNVAGSTKRTVSIVLMTASFSVGSVIAPQTFQARDAPDYIPAKIAVLAAQTLGAVIGVITFLYYVWCNRRKERLAAELEAAGQLSSDEKSWGNLTDKENPTFRYVY